MADPFLAEIRIVPFNFAPKGWALCNGQLLSIAQNQALFALLGTTYGGNGQSTFALPDLRGRMPFHVGDGLSLGQEGGAESHRLTLSELPAHTHAVRASSQPANRADPQQAAWAASSGGTNFAKGAPNTTMQAKLVSSVGGNQAHENRQPFLTLCFAIATQGIFPSPN